MKKAISIFLFLYVVVLGCETPYKKFTIGRNLFHGTGDSTIGSDVDLVHVDLGGSPIKDGRIEICEIKKGESVSIPCDIDGCTKVFLPIGIYVVTFYHGDESCYSQIAEVLGGNEYRFAIDPIFFSKIVPIEIKFSMNGFPSADVQNKPIQVEIIGPIPNSDLSDLKSLMRIIKNVDRDSKINILLPPGDYRISAGQAGQAGQPVFFSIDGQSSTMSATINLPSEID